MKERDLRLALDRLRERYRLQEGMLVNLQQELDDLHKKQANEQPHAEAALAPELPQASTSKGVQNTRNLMKTAARKPVNVDWKTFGAQLISQARVEKHQAVELLKKVERQLRLLQLESNTDKQQIPLLEAKISELTVVNDQAESEKKTLRRELHRLQLRNSGLEQRSATTPPELAQLRQEHERTQQELERQRQRATRLEGEKEVLQNEVERLRSELHLVNEKRAVRANKRKRKGSFKATKAVTLARKKRYARFRREDDARIQAENGDPEAFVEDTGVSEQFCSIYDQ
ncbi:hypothetical protein AAVH_21330 [Aphelenchoides avenae]|nr:hypothetical protein AAVH_21330 [Aphelenchus avenae]